MDLLCVSIGDVMLWIDDFNQNQGGGGGVVVEVCVELFEVQLQMFQDSWCMVVVLVCEQKQSQIQIYMNVMSIVGQMFCQVKGSMYVVLLFEGFDSMVLLGNSVEDQE